MRSPRDDGDRIWTVALYALMKLGGKRAELLQAQLFPKGSAASFIESLVLSG